MDKKKNLQNFLSHVSKKDSGWLEKAKWQEENEDWLDISFSIAVKVLSALTANKKADVFPRSQKELAEAMGCSAQYVNKLVRGQENLQIETICKIQRLLNVVLIEVPKTAVSQTISYEMNNFSHAVLKNKSLSLGTTLKYSEAQQTNNYSFDVKLRAA